MAVAISPLIILSILAQIFLLKLSKRTFSRILKGFVYTYLGFVLFLTGVMVGFMEAGQNLGMEISEKPLAFVLLIAFLIGLLVILAEPSVHILTTQIEDITGGAIKRRLILLALALGVSLAILLSVWRLYLPWLELWHLLLVLYSVALALTLKAPALFTGIAFDSGGVASGPMTATFVLSFVQGIAISQTGDVIVAFGTIAMVALTPLITLQLLGIIYHRREKRGERLG